jgi:ATP-dependent DNA ligase
MRAGITTITVLCCAASLGCRSKKSGRPSFNTLQNHGSAKGPIIYYVFDVIVLDGRDVMSEPLSTRRDLRSHILPKLGEPVRHCPRAERQSL